MEACQDGEHTLHTGTVDELRRVCHNHQTYQTQKQHHRLLPGEVVMDQKVSKEHGEHRVNGDDDGGQTGVGHHDADLEQGHAETDVDDTQGQKIPPVAQGEVICPAFQILQGEGQQDESADQKAEECQLEGGEVVPGDFQRNFHGAERKRG